MEEMSDGGLSANARMALVICPIRDRDPLRASSPISAVTSLTDGMEAEVPVSGRRRGVESDVRLACGEARAGHVNFS